MQALDELATEIEGIAEREGLSLNQAVVRLLRRAAGLERPRETINKIGDSLDWFIGTGTNSRRGSSTRRSVTSSRSTRSCGVEGPVGYQRLLKPRRRRA